MTYKCQKAVHLDDDNKKKQPYNHGKQMAVFEKYDGWFVYFDLEEGVFRTFTGREVPSLEHISEQLREKVGSHYKGRILCEALSTEFLDFPTLNGRLNRRKELLPGAYVRVHDFIWNHDTSVPFSHRYDKLVKFVNMVKLSWLKLAPILVTSDRPEHWFEVRDSIWEQGGEGIILKDLAAPYYASEGKTPKRHPSILKDKENVTRDLLVVGMESGRPGSKYAGTVGKLVVRDKAGTEYRVSGMRDDERDAWRDCPALIIGKVVEVRAMKVIEDTGMLREPRYKWIRHEKAPDDID